nr:MAG TPA: transposase [Caudoviricetes sp.]
MNAVLNERLNAIAAQLGRLPHGGKTVYLKNEAAKLGMSLATLHKKLDGVMMKPERKRRADAGTTALSKSDAQMISALILETMRKNGKRLMTVERAVEMLIANKEIDPVRVDKETGECFTLSTSTIVRALKLYKLHPDQLLQPAPVTALQSLHPNHVWQIDASLCVLFYLPTSGKDTGLRMMKADEFYKNKPKNVAKIEQDRVWRYVISDHCSGCLFVWYVFGGENSENLCEAYIQAMQPKTDRLNDPFCGVPKSVMLDPGSANTGHGFKSLNKQLGVNVIINKVGNPRAKGQVENGNNLVETQFESSLKLVRINSIDELQQLANRWMRYFNGQKVHSRHGMRRYQAWQKIEPEQLLIPPPADYCRELVLSKPEERKVNPDLTIEFGGRRFDVRDVPVVLVGEKITVAKNPWKPFSAQVQRFDAEGKEYWLDVPEVVINEFGFRVDAAVIGENYQAQADTPAQTHAKELEKIAMQADTLEQAEQNRKAKSLPFGGRIDPFAHQEQVLADDKVRYMPKRGTQMDYNRKDVQAVVLNKVELAKMFKARLEAEGNKWTAELMAKLSELYPDGAPERDIETVFATITQPKLKLVNGSRRTGTDG